MKTQKVRKFKIPKNSKPRRRTRTRTNPENYFLISLSLFLSLSELLSFSHALSSLPLTSKVSPLFQYWLLDLRSAWHRSAWRLWVGGIQIIMVRCLFMGSRWLAVGEVVVARRGLPWVGWSWLAMGGLGLLWVSWI